MRSILAEAPRPRPELGPQTSQGFRSAAEHDLHGVFGKVRRVVDLADMLPRPLEVVGDEPGPPGPRLHHEEPFAPLPAVHHGVEPARAGEEHGAARRVPREGTAVDNLTRLHHEGPVVHDEVLSRAEVLVHRPGRRAAPAGGQDHVHAKRPRGRDRGPRAGRDLLVAREQGAVDVEDDEADLRRAHRPVQISTRSIVSPGRIWSTTSIPESTWPNSV